MERKLIEVMREGDPRIPTEPTDTWWRRIPKTPQGGRYITGAAARNIPQHGQWAGWHGLMWNTRMVRAGNDGTSDGVELGDRRDWPYWGAMGILDVREGLRMIGHPVGKRNEPVYSASFARSVAEDVVGPARRKAPKWAYPERKETHHWLKRETQRDQLRQLLEIAREQMPEARIGIERWQHEVEL